ncbi:GAF domain-containing sensor histidine kinase [Christiangramia salexigens]|uniref:histidine kinase n=1 Tax=Christiangramia salexigens TaxID=1913577 RepID=A0A1L3J1P3_9FLAO|nr:ATP-binding protein [Christiangramia salexigens]APG59045.1 hypothetical protein LPB144_00880 [Christiangramia salexigens]
MYQSNIKIREELGIDVLKQYKLDEAISDTSLDNFVELAKQISGCSTGVISFFHKSKQYIKSQSGLNFEYPSNENSLCHYTLKRDEEYVLIPDMKKDTSFSSHPLVTGEPFLNFYFGIPFMVEGLKFGILCLMDQSGKELSRDQINGLTIIRDQILGYLESRKRNKQLNKKLNLYTNAEKWSKIGYFEWDLESEKVFWSDKWFYLKKASKSSEEKAGFREVKQDFTNVTFKKLLEKTNISEGSKKTFNEVLQVYDKTGKLKILHVEASLSFFNNDPFKLVGIARDMTKENDLKIEVDQLAYVLQNSLNEIYIFDYETLKFEYLNKGALENIGYSNKEIKELTPLDIKPEFTYEQFMEHIAPLMINKKKIVVFYTVHQRKDGSLYSVEVHLQIMNYKGKKTFVAIILDITEKVKSEKELLELNQSLIRSNEKLQHFAATTAHDLQEPLRMISNFTSLLAKKYSDQLDDKARQYIYYASDGADRMKILIQDILEYAELETGNIKKEDVDMGSVLKLVQQDLQPQISESNASITIDIPDIRLQANPVWMYRLLLNLFNNAIKFVKAGSPTIEFRAKEIEDKWEFSIADNGIGIKEQELENIFKIFYRLHTRTEFRGTGIGLAICKKIANIHGGEIWVNSTPGEGSTFYFTIPK